jgi:hypothetical protein
MRPGRNGAAGTPKEVSVNARTTVLTIGALFTVFAPAAHAAVVLGDGGGSSAPSRTPAALAKHVSPKTHASVKKHVSITALPDNHYQVLRDAL